MERFQRPLAIFDGGKNTIPLIKRLDLLRGVIGIVEIGKRTEIIIPLIMRLKVLHGIIFFYDNQASSLTNNDNEVLKSFNKSLNAISKEIPIVIFTIDHGIQKRENVRIISYNEFKSPELLLVREIHDRSINIYPVPPDYEDDGVDIAFKWLNDKIIEYFDFDITDN